MGRLFDAVAIILIAGLARLERLIRIEAVDWCVKFWMCDSSENYGLLEAFTICHCCHAVVTQSKQPLWEGRVLDINPSFLIKQEEMDVIKEWSAQVDANVVISSSNDQKCLV